MATFNEVDASVSTGTATGGDVRLPRAEVVSAAPQTGATNATTSPRVTVTAASREQPSVKFPAPP